MTPWLLFSAAYAGDVWLTIDTRTRASSVHLDLPAAILDEDEPCMVSADGASVDLHAVVREVAQMPEGSSRPLSTLVDGAPASIVVAHRALALRAPSRLRVTGMEARGRGVDLTLPLDGSSLGTAASSRGVRVQGLSLVFEDEAVADAIRRGKAGLLIDVIEADGGRVRIASQ